MNFPDLGVNKKVVDNVKNYQNMQYEENPFANFRENSQKPQKMKLLIKKLRFFGGNRAVWSVLDFDPLTTYRISKKSLEPISLCNFDLELNLCNFDLELNPSVENY